MARHGNPRPRGGIGRLDNQSIADEMFWSGDPEALVSALVGAGWIDEDAGCRLIVYGWSEHADDAVHMALARRGEVFADGTDPLFDSRALRLREEMGRKRSLVIARLTERDGDRCRACGTLPPAYHIDHVIPVSRGGGNELPNLQLLCRTCNLTKGARLPDAVSK